MAAAEELLVNGFVADPAVCRCHGRVDDKSVVVRCRLTVCNLVAIEAIQTLFRVGAQLEFVDYRKLRVPMALGALAARPHKRRARLLYDRAWPARIDEVGRKNQSRRDGDRNEYAAKIHSLIN